MVRRFDLIDLVRGAAAALVLLSHVAFWTGTSRVDVAGPLLARGDSGVAVFFAVSAFLLLRPHLEGRPQPLRTYAVRRLARIMPAYLLALVAVVAVAAWRPDQTGGIGGIGKVLAHLVLAQGYTDDTYQSFTQTWSLTTEATFYLLVPGVGPWLNRLGDRTVPALGCIALGGLAVQAWAAPSHPVLASSVLGHAAWFAAGALLALASAGRLRGKVARLLSVLISAPGLTLATAGAAYLIVSSPLGGPTGLRAPTTGEAGFKELAYTLIALLVLAAAITPVPGEAMAAIERSAFRRHAGQVSYGVFLWHVLVLQVLYVATGRALFSGGFVAVLVATVAITLMMAWASWTLIESPVLARAHQATRARSSQPTP